MQTTVTIDCPAEILPNVRVTYNMLATQKQFIEFSLKVFTNDDSPVIESIEGADRGSLELPMAFAAWLRGPGLIEAFAAYRDDPNWQTGRSRSTGDTAVAVSQPRPAS